LGGEGGRLTCDSSRSSAPISCYSTRATATIVCRRTMKRGRSLDLDEVQSCGLWQLCVDVGIRSVNCAPFCPSPLPLSLFLSLSLSLSLTARRLSRHTCSDTRTSYKLRVSSPTVRHFYCSFVILVITLNCCFADPKSPSPPTVVLVIDQVHLLSLYRSVCPTQAPSVRRTRCVFAS
jgi:hypothetical protein